MIGSLLFYILVPLSRLFMSGNSSPRREVPDVEETEDRVKKKSQMISEAQTKPGEPKSEGAPDVTEEDLVLQEEVHKAPVEEQFQDPVQDVAPSPNVAPGKSRAEARWCWDSYFAKEVNSCGSVYPCSTSSENRSPSPAGVDLSEGLCDVRHQETFAETKSDSSTQPEASLDFTVMSYNILAQDLLEAHEELYLHCPLEVLDWNYRFKILLQEIQRSLPDILCLQEVQENHYYDQLCPALMQMGYTCVFKCRTGAKTDGCATCYRGSLFTEVSASLLDFHRPETGLLDRHNVAVVLLLEPSASHPESPRLCVGNTHLLFNPSRGDVKLAQLGLLLAEVHHLSKSCRDEDRRCDVVLCGDFNAVPHSPLYQLITTGELYIKGLPTWAISGQEDMSHHHYSYRVMSPWPSCLEITNKCQYVGAFESCCSPSSESGKIRYSPEFLLHLRSCPLSSVRPPYLPLIPGVTDATPDDHRGTQAASQRSFTISHKFDLESVYKHVSAVSGALEVTTLHSQAGATVDYIFFTPERSCSTDAGSSRRGLTLLSCLSLPCEDFLWSLRGLPNHTFPSDHLSLLASFRMDLRAT
ncbi:protein angel homolog 1 [Synchiropus splendidus]|uniref:protein angel homolog 1 n=1 Tax=Synchiropus splendidus TaxID=270530 RepID=UPI00237E1539|nr:protein angel homolog 1 [Synchiropus splendidus]